jgi:hypothetical protein
MESVNNRDDPVRVRGAAVNLWPQSSVVAVGGLILPCSLYPLLTIDARR